MNAIFSPITLALLGIVLMGAVVANAPREKPMTSQQIFESALNQYQGGMRQRLNIR